MSNLHAALLESQIKKIELFLKKRQKIKQIYDNELGRYEILTQKQNEFSKSTNHLYVIIVKKFKKNLIEINLLIC